MKEYLPSQSFVLSEPVVQLFKYKLKIVIKSTRNSWSLICPISPQQPKSQITFGKKNPSQDFIWKIFVKCTYCLAACAEMDNQLAAHYRQDSWWCHKQISNSVSLHYHLEVHAVQVPINSSDEKDFAGGAIFLPLLRWLLGSMLCLITWI